MQGSGWLRLWPLYPLGVKSTVARRAIFPDVALLAGPSPCSEAATGSCSTTQFFFILLSDLRQGLRLFRWDLARPTFFMHFSSLFYVLNAPSISPSAGSSLCNFRPYFSDNIKLHPRVCYIRKRCFLLVFHASLAVSSLVARTPIGSSHVTCWSNSSTVLFFTHLFLLS